MYMHIYTHTNIYVYDYKTYIINETNCPCTKIDLTRPYIRLTPRVGHISCILSYYLHIRQYPINKAIGTIYFFTSNWINRKDTVNQNRGMYMTRLNRHDIPPPSFSTHTTLPCVPFRGISRQHSLKCSRSEKENSNINRKIKLGVWIVYISVFQPLGCEPP